MYIAVQLLVSCLGFAECSDGGVRLLTSFSDSDAISDALNGVFGDVHGIIDVCENQLWKRVVLCLNGGGEQWSSGEHGSCLQRTRIYCTRYGFSKR